MGQMQERMGWLGIGHKQFGELGTGLGFQDGALVNHDFNVFSKTSAPVDVLERQNKLLQDDPESERKCKAQEDVQKSSGKKKRDFDAAGVELKFIPEYESALSWKFGWSKPSRIAKL